MAIISVSRGCYSHGKKIAQLVADELGYQCVGREIVIEAADFYKIPKEVLLKSLHDAPGLLERITHGRDRFLAGFQATLLQHVQKDNVVYHGHAGHLLLPPIRHIFKVRIIADMQERIKLLQEERSLLPADAEKEIEREDRNRAHWTRYLYNRDINDARLYDMVVHIGTFKIEDVCRVICETARSASFQSTDESRNAVKDLAISSQIQVALMPIADAEVTSHMGAVHIRVAARKIRQFDFTNQNVQSKLRHQLNVELNNKILEVAGQVPGVKTVACDIDSPELS
ncbi:MAG: cytidylate kinase-like family protein [Deltaproteobacteria bacterium]|nr:cytidylate kinase-like family protein [Deltaproteobacteria bacterium]